MLENVVKKGTREILVLVDLQDMLEAKGARSEKGEKGDVGGAGPKAVQV